MNTELKCILISRPLKTHVLLYSQHCPLVVQPYVEHSAYFLYAWKRLQSDFIFCANLCSKSPRILFISNLSESHV